ncbi:natterin-3-like [Sardina pilchardus]|uniref:natterin-3-like n=1 Tax=Sardina pilchardus TaxID=27697 RepID=UPI002E1282CC
MKMFCLEMEPAPVALLILLNIHFQHPARPEGLPLPDATATRKAERPPDLDLGEVTFNIASLSGTVTPPNRKGLHDYSNFPKTKSEKVDFGISHSETTLLWVPFRDTTDLEVGYKVKIKDFEQYVCRPTLLRLSGYLQLSDGYFCIYALGGHVYTTVDFELLVNTDDFELLEWIPGEYGSVPAYSIKSSTSNFVGRNKYGLGNVNTDKKAFYLPWIADKKEYQYSSYEVLTVVHEPYNQHLSQVFYFSEKANITRHHPHTLKKSRVTNNHNQQVTKTVRLAESTETVNTWEIGFSVSLSMSYSVSAGIPTISQTSVSFGLETSFSLSKSSSKSQSKEHSLTVEVIVPAGQTCEVRMEGTKTEAAIPFRAHLTKTYKDGREHHANITGMYRGTQVGEINAVVEQCVSVLVNTDRLVRGAATPSTQAPSLTWSLVTSSLGVACLAAAIIS